MTDFDFANAYEVAKRKRSGEEPSSSEIWTEVAWLYCRDFCDEHDLDPDELKLDEVQVSEDERSPVVVTIRVVYKGKVIVLELEDSRLVNCYLEGRQHLSFPSLGAAIDDIENETKDPDYTGPKWP